MMQPELMLKTDYDNPQQNLHNPPLTKPIPEILLDNRIEY